MKNATHKRIHFVAMVLNAGLASADLANTWYQSNNGRQLTNAEALAKFKEWRGIKDPLSDQMLWKCLDEADQRKADPTLPLDVRISSAQTYAICLRAAADRGHTYDTLKEVACRT